MKNITSGPERRAPSAGTFPAPASLERWEKPHEGNPRDRPGAHRRRARRGRARDLAPSCEGVAQVKSYRVEVQKTERRLEPPASPSTSRQPRRPDRVARADPRASAGTSTPTGETGRSARRTSSRPPPERARQARSPRAGRQAVEVTARKARAPHPGQGRLGQEVRVRAPPRSRRDVSASGATFRSGDILRRLDELGPGDVVEIRDSDEQVTITAEPRCRGRPRLSRRVLAGRTLRRRTGLSGHSARAQPSRRRRVESLPPPAQGQPGRLVPVGHGGVRPGEVGGQADLPLDRLLDLPLVPRHGARVVRERADRRAAEPRLRLDQGGPGGAARRRRHLHDGRPDHDRQRRLAPLPLSDARRASPSTAGRTFLRTTAAAGPASRASSQRSRTPGRTAGPSSSPPRESCSSTSTGPRTRGPRGRRSAPRRSRRRPDRSRPSSTRGTGDSAARRSFPPPCASSS